MGTALIFRIIIGLRLDRWGLLLRIKCEVLHYGDSKSTDKATMESPSNPSYSVRLYPGQLQYLICDLRLFEGFGPVLVTYLPIPHGLLSRGPDVARIC